MFHSYICRNYWRVAREDRTHCRTFPTMVRTKQVARKRTSDLNKKASKKRRRRTHVG